MPAYYDSLGNATPVLGGGTLNFYAYFSAYGSNSYDPNDVNFYNNAGTAPIYLESDANGDGPIALAFSVAYPLYNSTSPDVSYSPNPYTSTLTEAYSAVNTAGPPNVTYQTPQSFQIISAGIDGLYGVGPGAVLLDPDDGLNRHRAF